MVQDTDFGSYSVFVHSSQWYEYEVLYIANLLYLAPGGRIKIDGIAVISLEAAATMMNRACAGTRSVPMYCTVEWSPKISEVRSRLQPFTTHFVLPNLPSIITPDQENSFFSEVQPQNRIRTIAASLHDHKSLRIFVADNIHKVDKYLLVGGNSKNKGGIMSLSTVEASRIIQGETDVEIWGVANPNDRTSVEMVTKKLEAGIRGIITQPFFSSHALEVFESYPRHPGVSFIAGLALPTRQRDILFWLDLLGQPDLVEDPLTRSHIEFFSSSDNASLTWAEKELAMLKGAAIDGVHYMPMKNIDDLLRLMINTPQ